MEKVTIYASTLDRHEIDYDFIKNFKVLVIEGVTELTIPIIQNLQNQIVHFQLYLNDFLQNPDFIVLIKNWVAKSKPIGSCFTFLCFEDESGLITILNRVRDQIEGAVAGDKCVNIPMSNSTVLKVSYEECTEIKSLIKMTVVPL
uniref:FBA_2 domain-containing protein n=1 Tax=Caenorhabditis tropicalis TaxID=1561998 RepID=A0A1I7TAK0_9PELO